MVSCVSLLAPEAAAAHSRTIPAKQGERMLKPRRANLEDKAQTTAKTPDRLDQQHALAVSGPQRNVALSQQVAKLRCRLELAGKISELGQRLPHGNVDARQSPDLRSVEQIGRCDGIGAGPLVRRRNPGVRPQIGRASCRE